MKERTWRPLQHPPLSLTLFQGRNSVSPVQSTKVAISHDNSIIHSRPMCKYQAIWYYRLYQNNNNNNNIDNYNRRHWHQCMHQRQFMWSKITTQKLDLTNCKNYWQYQSLLHEDQSLNVVINQQIVTRRDRAEKQKQKEREREPGKRREVEREGRRQKWRTNKKPQQS